MKRIFTALLVILIVIYYGQHSTTQLASAAIKNGEMITLTQSNQVIDTIEYNGATIEAVYSNKSYASNDTTYSCAAFIKKFYQTVYGVTVYNLINSSSIPLVYDNKGSFSLTNQPQKGDIVRDNTRTHWAIVKAISGNTITIIQQSYRSGTSAWINCTIDKADTGFSYFTYSNRIPDAAQNGEEAIIKDANIAPVEGGDASLPTDIQGDASGVPAVIDSSTVSISEAKINNGTYLLIDGTGTAFIEAKQSVDKCEIQAAKYSGLENQKISIINHGNNQYSLQFLSNQSFLSVSKEKKFAFNDTVEQKFVFVHRGNGYYTISLADNLNTVIVVNPQSQDGCGGLVWKEFSGALNELWILNQISNDTLPIHPQVTVNSKALYIGDKNYTIKIKQLFEGSTVSYHSSNPKIASVSTKGIIRPVKEGKAIITVEVRQENTTYISQIAVTVKDNKQKSKAAK